MDVFIIIQNVYLVIEETGRHRGKMDDSRQISVSIFSISFFANISINVYDLLSYTKKRTVPADGLANIVVGSWDGRIYKVV